MIDLYTGTPGSGKSVHLMERIKAWITRFDCPVVANFEIDAWSLRARKWGGFLYLDNENVCPENMYLISEEYRRKRKWERMREDQIFLIIDECQLLFNAREWQSADRKEWLRFFTQHRKLGYRVVLCCQYDQMIDKQVRALIEYEYLHRKVKNIGKAGAIMDFLAGGNLHVVVKIYKPLNTKVGSEFFRAKASLYRLYDTYKIFDSNPETAKR